MRQLIIIFIFVAVLVGGCRSYHRLDSEASAPPSVAKDALISFIKDGKIDRMMVLFVMKGGLFKDDKGNFSSQRFIKFLNDLADVPYHGKVKRAIMWRVYAPDGSQHWIFGTQHRLYPLENYPSNSQLFTATEQATIYMPEITIETTVRMFGLDPSKPNHKQAIEQLNKMLDKRINALGKSKNKKIIEMDDFLTADKHSKEWQKARESAEKTTHRGFKDSKEFLDYQFNKFDLYLQKNQAYIDGDIDKYTQLSKQADPYWSIITDRRNKMWLKKIVEHCHGDERCFIYAGVNHFINDAGSLTALLRGKGFNIERVD